MPPKGSGRQNRTDVSRLCDMLFGGTPLAPYCLLWATREPRFAAFLDAWQGKIGKKLRGIGDEGGYLDLLAELDVAHRLLAERSFTLVYEPWIAERQRGPDFTVTFKTHTACHVEVRRLRPSSATADAGARLITILADKLRQLAPSAPNVLALSGATGVTSAAQLSIVITTLAAPARQRDDAACAHLGFVNARDLLRRLERLSAIALLEPAPAFLWEQPQPQARYPLLPDLRKAMQRALCDSVAG